MRVAVLVVAVAALCAAQAAAITCCPKCVGNNGGCYLVNEEISVFSKGSECLAGCAGSCVYASKGSYVCGAEVCGPDPCHSTAEVEESFADAEARLRGRKLHVPIGTCLMGHNTSANGVPLRGQDVWLGDYAFHVNQSWTKVLHEQVPIATKWKDDPSEGGLVVGGNAVFWPEQDAETQNWSMRARLGGDLVSYNFTVGHGGYPPVVGASEQIITYSYTEENDDGGVQHYASYDVKHPPSTLISDVTFPLSKEMPVMVEGKMVYALSSKNNNYVLRYWDAFLPEDVKTVNISVKDCNVAGSKDSSDEIQTATVINGRLMFSAFSNNHEEYYTLCTTWLPTGKTTPLFAATPDYTRAYSYVEMTWAPTGIVYTAAAGTNVQVNGLVACNYPASTTDASNCVWVDQSINDNSDYTYTALYTGYHLPARFDGAARATMYKDVVVYRVYGEIFLTSFFGYNLTSHDVYPIALVYAIPNTHCDKYTGDDSNALSQHQFNEVFVLQNGTLLFGVGYNLAGGEYNDLVSVTSPFLLEDQVGCAASGGCSLHGGTCAYGKCYCQPGCYGSDCSQGMSQCSPPAPADDDDF